MKEPEKDEAFFLIDHSAYLHVQATVDSHVYTADGCYTTYEYTFFSWSNPNLSESGEMEIFDMTKDPQQNLLDAAENILTCRFALGGCIKEPMTEEMIAEMKTLCEERQSADGEISKSSVLDSLRQKQANVKKTPPEKPRHVPER